MTVAVEKVLSYPGLSDREVRLILTVDTLQGVRDVIKAELGELLSVSLSTVERTLRKLKEKGLLFMQRIGSSRWAYRFSMALHLGDEAHVSTEHSFYSLENIEETLQNSIIHMALLPGDDPRLEMAPIKSKFQTPLVDALVGAAKRKPKEPRRPKPFTKQSREERLREKKKTKDVSEYSTADIRFEFEDEWRKKWSGACPRWNGKDFGLMKRMLEDYGPKDTVKYVQYVISNWEDISRRYKVNGYPSVSILWSYGSSMYTEMVNGVTSVTTAEYRDRSMVDDSEPVRQESEDDREAKEAIRKAMERSMQKSQRRNKS